jgi:predicted anti-sigma-YlaC factor YlaD
MDCAEFEVLLFGEFDRELASRDVERMRAHLRTCVNCRGLHSLVRGDEQQAVAELPHDFAAGVVASTSGRPCQRAQLLLAASEGDASDDDASDDGWLVARHLERCPDCSAVARTLAQLRLELPTLAEADAGDSFVTSVMSATLGDRRTRASHKTGPRRFFEQLLRRPRIALEGSYAVAMLVLAVFGLPSPSFSELHVRAAEDAWRSAAEAARTAAVGLGKLNAGTLSFFDEVAESASANAVELGATLSGSSRELTRTVWDGLLAPNVEEVRSLWNEKASGAVEPDTSIPKRR